LVDWLNLMSVTPQTSAEDRGASAILIALCLFLLMGFAAIAVDSGLAFDERRQEQGGVDAGTLSAGIGAQVSPMQPGCGAGNNIQQAACNGAVVAIGIINTNADAPYPLAAFDDPTFCPDSVFPAEFHPGNPNDGILATVDDGGTTRTLDCLRWTENLSKVRIVLPVTNVNTTFGRVLGRTTIDVSALAEAEALIKRPGQLIPFVVGPTGGGANLGCLYEPPSGIASPPCDGPAQGNFGYMLPYLYGDTVLGTPIECNPIAVPPNQSTIASTLAKGADHVYALNSSVPGIANDASNCPNKNQLIDEIDVRTGSAANPVEVGALESIYGTEGRLRCKDGDSGEPTWVTPIWSSIACDDVNNQHPETLDSTPLWNFINPGAASESAGACNSSISDRTGMEACLVGWRAYGIHSIALFTSSLASSPRFAWVPRVNIDPETGGSGFYTIEEFLPVYLQTLYLRCTPGGCDVVFDPGEPSIGPCVGFAPSCGWPSNGNKNLDAMSAFILRTDMLPFPLDQFPGAPGQMIYNLSA
jgi:hypothetical protein